MQLTLRRRTSSFGDLAAAVARSGAAHDASVAGRPKATMSHEAIARWRAEVESLDERQRQAFLEALPDGSLDNYASAVQKVVVDKLEGSRTVKIAAWLQPLVSVVDMVKPFQDSLKEVYPPAATILGGVICVLKLSSSFSKYQESLLAAFRRMADALRVINKYKSVFPSTPEMQLALMEVYGDILKFCSQASSPFLNKSGRAKSTAHIFVSSHLKSFENELEPIEKSLAQHLGNFDRVVNLVLGQMSTEIRKTQVAGLKIQHRV